MEHGQHGRRPEGPAEPDGQVGELDDQGDAEGDQGLAAQLGADGGADELVPQLFHLAADLGDGPLDLLLAGRVELAGAHGQVAVPGGLHDRSGEAGVSQDLAGGVQVDRPGRLVLEQAAAGELHPEVGPTHHQPGASQDQRHQRPGQPPAGPAEQVRAAGGEPGGQPPTALQAEQAGTPADGAGPGHQLDQDPGDDQGGEQRHQDPDGQGDPEPAYRP
jgi:hypothetical protein